MTPGEKRSYRAQLKSFTSRTNRLYVHESGAVSPYSEVAKHKTPLEMRAEAFNRRLAAQRRRIDAIEVNRTVSGAGNIKTIAGRQRERGLEERDANGKKTGRVHQYMGSVYGAYNVHFEESPADEKTARRRAEALKKMTERSWSDRRDKLRLSAIEMARFAGDEELADRIEALSDDQFDVLTQRTNFMDELATMYAPYAGAKSRKEKAVAVSLDDQGGISTQAEALIDVVERAVPRAERTE